MNLQAFPAAEPEWIKKFYGLNPNLIYRLNLEQGELVGLEGPAEQILGCEASELLFKTPIWEGWLAPEDQHKVQAARAALSRLPEDDKSEFQVLFCRPDGKKGRWVLSETVLLRTSGGQVLEVLGVLRDDSAAWKAEQAAAQPTQALSAAREAGFQYEHSENVLRALLDAIPEIAFLIDVDGKVIIANRALCQRFQTSLDIIIGRKMDAFLPAVEAEARQRYLELALADGRPLQVVDELDGRVYQNYLSPVLSTEGKANWLAVLSMDITDRLAAERSLAQKAEELARSNAELEQFAYVASHDLQEPLRMVSSFTQLLAKRYQNQLDEKADQYISFIVDGATRMQALIDDMLMYSRVTTRAKAFGPTDCNDLLRQVMQNIQLAAAENAAEVTWDLLPVVMADETQLGQLFQNLISNAIKFHGDLPPQVRISVQKREADWLFAVKDNGIGIDAKYSERVFVIFQRLHNKQKYPGTGIGLAVCKKVVERHGGKIWFTSTPGQGTTFLFTLPFAQPARSLEER